MITSCISKLNKMHIAYHMHIHVGKAKVHVHVLDRLMSHKLLLKWNTLHGHAEELYSSWLLQAYFHVPLNVINHTCTMYNNIKYNVQLHFQWRSSSKSAIFCSTIIRSNNYHMRLGTYCMAHGEKSLDMPMYYFS